MPVHPPTPPLPSSPSAREAGHLSLELQLQALLQFQTTTPCTGLPCADAATQAQALAVFAPWCQQHPRGRAWRPADEAAWQRVSQALVLSAVALPAVALLGDGGRAGPLLYDVALLLRGHGVHEDEGQELDAAIRWWDGARRAGLPVDADFGECWRALEWLALQQHLLRLAAAAEDGQEQAALTAAVAKVALGYGPLKPLLRLLPAQPGADVGAGYTF